MPILFNFFLGLLMTTLVINEIKAQKNIDLFIFKRVMNFKTAQTMCKLFGYDLMRIDNLETNKMIASVAETYNFLSIWLDGNDIKKEGTFVDSNKKKLKYKNFKPNEPNNFKNEDCIEMQISGYGGWNDQDCDNKRNVICSRISNKTAKQMKKTKEKTKISIYSPKLNIVLAKGDFTYKEASDLCKEEGLEMIRILDEKTNKFIFKIGGSFKIGRYWIDTSALSKEISFSNSMSKIIFRENKYPAPCYAEKALYSSFWEEVDCKLKMSVICE